MISLIKSSGGDSLDQASACASTPGCGIVPSCSLSDGWFTGPGTDTCFVPHAGSQTQLTCTSGTPLLNNGTAFAGGCSAASVCVTKPSVNTCAGIQDPWTCNGQSGKCELSPG